MTDTEARAGAVAALAATGEIGPERLLDAILVNPAHSRALLRVLLDPEKVAAALERLEFNCWPGGVSVDCDHAKDAAALIAALTEDQPDDRTEDQELDDMDDRAAGNFT
jgi:hypothetical protein